MKSNLTLKFKRNESFYIREGWIEKAINAIKEYPNENVFSEKNGVLRLGIGSNMVKSLKYWLETASIIALAKTTTSLTEFGELIYQYDRYCESDFVWFLIHYMLVKNRENNPVGYAMFDLDMKTFTKADASIALVRWFKDHDYQVNDRYIDDDLNVFLKSYVHEDSNANPEDNYVCPLTNLNLIKGTRRDYSKNRPSYTSLSYLIVYYALCDKYAKDKEFNIEDVFKDELSVCKIFNLDKNQFLQYLDEMRNRGFITINKTAGLNTVYFEKKLSLAEIFEMEFKK